MGTDTSTTAAPVEDPAVRRRQALRKSAADMLRTLAVVVAVVVGIVLLVPRPNSVNQPPVDVARAAAAAADGLGFTPAVPAGLPPGWSATSAKVQRGTDGVATWHVGYLTPAGRAGGYVQAARPTPAWENAQVTDGAEQGTVDVGGTAWLTRSRLDRGITSLVLRGTGPRDVTTIVTGRATPDELRQLITALALPPA